MRHTTQSRRGVRLAHIVLLVMAGKEVSAEAVCRKWGVHPNTARQDLYLVPDLYKEITGKVAELDRRPYLRVWKKNVL